MVSGSISDDITRVNVDVATSHGTMSPLVTGLLVTVLLALNSRHIAVRENPMALPVSCR